MRHRKVYRYARLELKEIVAAVIYIACLAIAAATIVGLAIAIFT